MLATTLYHNIKVRESWDASHARLTLEVPTKRPGWLIPPVSWVVRPPTHRALILDSMGADLWAWSDGKRTVEEVIEKFAVKHSLTFHESRVSATSYLKELVRRGALAIAI